jgi:hypothetical protein
MCILVWLLFDYRNQAKTGKGQDLDARLVKEA